MREILRKLASNCDIVDFNYNTKLGFQTVFYKPKYAYSYCFCQCGLENEFLGYIADDGSIDEHVFEKIVKSMIDGKCPHVTSNVPKEWIQETCVTAAHIAVAAGTKLENKNEFRDVYLSNMKTEGIFNVDLYAIALLKKKFERVSHYYCSHMAIQLHDQVIPFCKTLENSPYSVVIKAVPNILALVQSGNQKLLAEALKPKYNSLGKCITHKHSHLEEAIQYTWKYSLTEARKTLLELRKYTDYSGYSGYIIQHLKTITMYDQGDVLAEFLKQNPQKHFLLLPCEVLERPKCKEILSQFQRQEETEHLSNTAQTGLLIDLLGIYFEEFKDEILTALKKIPNYCQECRKWVLSYICTRSTKPEVLETVLALALSDDDNYSNDLAVKKLIRRLLGTGNLYYDSWTRETLKLVLKLNTSVEDLEHNVVAKALKVSDSVKKKYAYKGFQQFKQENFEEVYQADAKEHGIFGYDGDDFAMNFARPFLLESGFKIPKQDLEVYLETELHAAERNYLMNYMQQNLDRPKTLAKICRDTLRKYFRGLKLHKFLEMSNCPNLIKDYVLLNYSLKPNHRVSYNISLSVADTLI